MTNDKVEPIAVIGMSCRFPGANNIQAFWELLEKGKDPIVEVPKTRWNVDDYYDSEPGVHSKMYTRWGGFLNDVDQFDPEFFGISPREAERMDPQQRLTLEVAWEALESAAIAPESLKGSQCGVFIGIGNQDFTRQLYSDINTIESHNGTGGTLSMAANRISYFLDLHGPAVGVESACSSSLLSLHLACNSLRSQESNIAVAGGVNMVLSPDMTIAFSQARMMSPTGRCRTFDKNADGYVRSEGCGIVILKPLKQAIKDGNRILALIRGSAINQDGMTNGITAPNSLAQQEVITKACQNAGVNPSDISYVEAHGTGTPVGDPIEFRALRSVLMKGRDNNELCLVGSVKTNIGHLEAAAGIAGVIKTIAALQNQCIPANLHLKELNPRIVLEKGKLLIPTTNEQWKTIRGTRLAGVSSFSFGGNNCHLILEEAPTMVNPLVVSQSAKVHEQEKNSSIPVANSTELLTFSAKTANALIALVESYVRYCKDHSTVSLAQMAFTLGDGRNHFTHRLAVVADSVSQLQEKLQCWLNKEHQNHGLASGVYHQYTARLRQSTHVVFMFTGQGGTLLDIGRELCQNNTAFRQALQRCDKVLLTYLDLPIEQILSESENNARLLSQARYIQPILFSVEYALAMLWISLGVKPKALIGHSLGEYVAACVAGVFTLTQALTLIAERGRLTQTLSNSGGMLVVFAELDDVQSGIRDYQDSVSIAAVNGEKNTVIAGDKQVLENLLAFFTQQNIQSYALEVSSAFHSPLMKPIVEPFYKAASQIEYQAPRLPLISCLTGKLWEEEECCNADYWCRHIIEPVNFFSGFKQLLSLKHRLFVEIGPGSTLTRIVQHSQFDDQPICIESLANTQSSWHSILQALAKLYINGVNIDWKQLYVDKVSLPIELPTYPFQRKSYWYKSELAFQLPNQSLNTTTIGDSKTVTNDLQEQTGESIPDIIQTVKTQLASLLHLDPMSLDTQTPFLELGADSLILIDAIRQCEKSFGVKIEMRQLFDDLSNVERLAAFIESRMTPVREKINSTNASQVISTIPVKNRPVTTLNTDTQVIESTDNSIQHLLKQQLDIIANQLEVLKVHTSNTNEITHKNIELNERFVKSAMSKQTSASTDNNKPFETAKSPPQKAHLKQYTENFIKKYIKHTPNSRISAEQSRSYLADSRASAGFRLSIKEMLYPIVGDHGQGACFWDIDNNEYLDISMGFGVLLLGHQPPCITDAIQQQLSKGLLIGPQAKFAQEAAKLIHELTGVERVGFCNTGTEAVMTALRLARTFTKRDKIVLFSGSYHGHSDAVLASSQGQPSCAGIPNEMVDSVYVLDYANPESMTFIQQHGDELAAVLVEPVQSRHPELQPHEFLTQLREVTEKHNIVLIFDEVLTGFRVHPGGAQAWFNIKADLVTYGKIIGGGLPIGVVAGCAPLMDGIDGGRWCYGDDSLPIAPTTFFAGTFNKNHLAMAATVAMLRYLKQQGPQLQQTLNELTKNLADRLNLLFKTKKVPIHVVYFSSMFRFQFNGNFDLFFYHLIEKGIYIWEGRNCFLSTVHTEKNINFLVQCVEQTIDEMSAGGWFDNNLASVTDNSNKETSSKPLGAQEDKFSEVHSSHCVVTLLPHQLQQNLQPVLNNLCKENNMQGYAEAMEKVNRLALAYVQSAFLTLGWPWESGQSVNSQQLLQKLGIAPEYYSLVARLLHLLTDAGVLINDDSDYLIVSPQFGQRTTPVQLDQYLQQIRQESPELSAELALVERCGQELSNILSGKSHPLEVLFPKGDLTLACNIYTSSPISLTMNSLLQQAVSLLADQAESQKPLKLLEIGAGTGGTTSYVLPALSKHKVTYTFSDISTHFLEQAKINYSAYAFVNFRVLDIEKTEPDGERYDIVIAANVLHATSDIQHTLKQVRKWLAPGGILLLLEVTKRAPWLDIVFGLTPGWWKFDDHDLRQSSPLLYPEQWQTCLEAAEFDQIQWLLSHGSSSHDRHTQQSLMIARNPRWLRLSENQRAMWIATRMSDRASRAYNVCIKACLTGAIDLQRLQESVTKLLIRHDALRLIFSEDGQFQKVLHIDQMTSFIEIHTLAESEAEKSLRQWGHQSMDLSKGPLVKFELVRISNNRFWLVVVAHHLIIDGQSALTLMTELLQLYQGVELADAIPFSNYLYQLEHVSGSQIKESEDYWLSLFKQGVPIVDLPCDRERPAVQSYIGLRIQQNLNRGLYKGINEFAVSQNCTLFMTLLTAFNILIYRLTHQQQCLLGISSAGQNALGQGQLIGSCVNVLPLLLTTLPEMSVSDLMSQVRVSVLDAYQHQLYPFSRLVKNLETKRDPSRASLLDIYFNFDKQEAPPQITDADVVFDSFLSGAVRRDLTWNPVEIDDGISIVCDYSTDLFDEHRIRQWIAEYENILKHMILQPATSIQELLIKLEPQGLAISARNMKRVKRKGEVIL